MVAFGREANAGIAVHVKTSTKSNMERHFTMNTCYVWCKNSNIADSWYALVMEIALDRQAVARRGKQLECFTIVWNSLEGLVAVVAGALAGSISLVGFGIDSFIEVTSGGVLLWRMSADADARKRERREKLSLRIVGVCFLALAAYVSYESISVLISKKAPEHSIPGIVLACVSLVVMPLLSRAKKKVSNELGSAAMHADARQTDFCVYLSAILLLGLLLNAALGWWWADPTAALIMVPLIAKEGVEAMKGEMCSINVTPLTLFGLFSMPDSAITHSLR